MESKKKREGFSSGLAVFFATLGSAVGLGNIWKFPYLTGQNGGGAFVFVYLICILLVGIPVMVAEFYIGRRGRKNAVGAFKQLKAGKHWSVIGYLGVLSTFLIMFFYSSVAGWVYSYVFKSLKGDFNILKGKSIEEAVTIVNNNFNNTIGGNIAPIVWQAIVLLVVGIIIMLGVQKGIEKVTKTLMPVLFFLIIICDIRALTLSASGEGLKFLFGIDFSKITTSVILSALGLAFFKLSIGMGTMITYSSYFTEDNNLLGTSFKVALSDTLVSLLAGIAIFPVVFQFGMKPEGGPGLLFNTIPLVFSQMPMGSLLLVLFFLLTAFAATMAMLSMAEVIVAFLAEERGLGRGLSTLISLGTVFIVGALTVHKNSIFAHVSLFNKNFFDFFDFLSSNILLPVGGLLIAIFVGYIVKKEEVIEELSNKNTLNNKSFINTFRFILRYITPILLFIIFIQSIGII
ncbi:sodium-dependent transporter [Hathewaya massiliensis]|uniref:sodium-dependent transporter n=1 Tax=Hathewaya massiliensis TaxID=1964382 RepID=UPI00115700F0|nr:sodium-dependent transporter [Hathewaya massiliensis]